MGSTVKEIRRGKYLSLFHLKKNNGSTEWVTWSPSVQKSFFDKEIDYSGLPAKELLSELQWYKGYGSANIVEIGEPDRKGSSVDWSIQTNCMI